jgi:hypothetical protein
MKCRADLSWGMGAGHHCPLVARAVCSLQTSAWRASLSRPPRTLRPERGAYTHIDTCRERERERETRHSYIAT